MKKRRFTKLLAIGMVLAVLLSLWPLSVHGEEPKVVRVGYVISPGFQEGGDGEYKKGQGYDYLQKIAGYSGWIYEYEYGDFNTLLQKLYRGEIDLMGNLSYTEERAESISYGFYEQGKETFHLYINVNQDSGIRGEDVNTINGKRVGVTVGSYQEELWTKWCEDRDIHCGIVEYENFLQSEEALNNGDVDGVLGSLILSSENETSDWYAVLEFGESPYYFGVNKARPDLLKELNEAQQRILNENPYYNEELTMQYMRNGVVSYTKLQSNELDWLNEHEEIIKVGCLDDYLPLSDQKEDGTMVGVVPDLLKELEENYANYDVRFEQIVYKDYHDMLTDLKSGVIDLATPIFADYWYADQEGISLTNTFMSTTMLLLNKSSYAPSEVQRLGIDQQSPIQTVFAEIYFSDYEIVKYENMSQLAKALVDGKVDAGLSTACCYHIAAKLDLNVKNLNRATLPQTVNMAIAVSKENPELMSLMNRGISMIPEAQIFNSLAINSNVDKKTTLADYVAENPIAAMMISGVTILALVIIILRLHRAIQKARTDQMTGLLNKSAMHEQIKDHLDEGGVLFMIDIDDFKSVNDILGHKAGDEVIISFAESLQKIFRTGDIIGRFGGDEFMVFLPGSHCSEEVVADKVRQMEAALKECSVFTNHSERICSVSVGVLTIEKGANAAYNDVFNKVDAALYKAKDEGKNTFHMERF